MSLGEGVDGAGGSTDLSFGRRLADTVAHAAVLTLLAVLVFAAISFGLGGRWVGVKWLLFFGGFLALGVGGLLLRPTPIWRDEPLISRDPAGRTPLERLVDRLLGPLAIDPASRFPSSARVLLAGLFMLVISYVMETVFGVAL